MKIKGLLLLIMIISAGCMAKKEQPVYFKTPVIDSTFSIAGISVHDTISAGSPGQLLLATDHFSCTGNKIIYVSKDTLSKTALIDIKIPFMYNQSYIGLGLALKLKISLASDSILNGNCFLSGSFFPNAGYDVRNIYCYSNQVVSVISKHILQWSTGTAPGNSNATTPGVEVRTEKIKLSGGGCYTSGNTVSAYVLQGTYNSISTLSNEFRIDLKNHIVHLKVWRNSKQILDEKIAFPAF